MTHDLQRRVAEGPLTTFQLIAIGVCVCLNMLDGFDILAMSFAASGVKTDWHLADGQLGYLFSAGLVGMGIGSLTVAPWADRFGRRPIVLLSVAIAGFGMVGSAAAPGFAQLLVLRVFTGIGIGGTIASVVDGGWTPAHLYVLFAVPYVLAALAMVGLGGCGLTRIFS